MKLNWINLGKTSITNDRLRRWPLNWTAEPANLPHTSCANHKLSRKERAFILLTDSPRWNSSTTVLFHPVSIHKNTRFSLSLLRGHAERWWRCPTCARCLTAHLNVEMLISLPWQPQSSNPSRQVNLRIIFSRWKWQTAACVASWNLSEPNESTESRSSSRALSLSRAPFVRARVSVRQCVCVCGWIWNANLTTTCEEHDQVTFQYQKNKK